MRQSGQLAKYSAAQTSSVKLVQFTSFSKQELQAWSVAQIKQSRLYQGGRPVPGSPNDLRLGVSTMDQKCQTCGQTRQCPGHFGHIKLAEPVFHYGYMKYIQKILKCVCHNCHKLKTFKNNFQIIKFMKVLKIANPNKRLSEAAKILASVSKCGQSQNDKQQQKKIVSFCGSDIPTKIQLQNHKIYVNDKVYDSRKVYKILSGISTEDARLLGFTKSKPVYLMIDTLAVAPPQIRPSIQMNPQKRAEDDITSAYVRIVSINNELKNNKIQSSQKAQKIQDMERIVASIMVKLQRVKMEKTVNGKKKKVMKTIKSIQQRLKGKQGRFRQNLMGKRVDFSARSVISGDACLALDQLGVPQKIARQLTIPEEITEWNYERIVKLCKQGKVRYLIRPNNQKKTFQDVINFVKVHDSNEIQKYLNYGMVIQRCLQNGDYVLFNRQPTLHRMSMMSHRVRILPYNTFRLNLSVCTPYNADFDGDQMNMHVPQSYETISQLKHIAHVPKQIIAPKNNAPVMGIVQDALLGLYLFSMRDTFLTREEIMNLVIWIQHRQGRNISDDQLLPGQLPMPAILKPEPLWTGKQVMSMIIPDKITIQILKQADNDTALRNIKDINMIIRKGQLLSGALQKEVVGSGPGGLVHSIWLQIGPDATNQFMTTAQRVVNNWLIQNGFTVGASDIVLSKQLQALIKKDHEEIIKLYFESFNNYRNEAIIQERTLHQRGKKIMDSFEFYINSQLNSRLGLFQKSVANKVSPYLNNIFKMITSKSKGSQTNLAQIMFSLGNQNVDGRRVPLGFAKRSLPHFSKDDNSPQSRGFVFSSFYKGLKPHQFFFHSMGGREGLSDTAVKTARTGYIQRKLVKSLQDIVVKYDGTVRDSGNNLLQKLYGQDSFAAEYIEKHKAQGIQLSIQDFKKKMGWDQKYLINKYDYNTDYQIPKLKQQLDNLLYCRQRLRAAFINGNENFQVQYYCPIKVQRLINKIRAGKSRHQRDQEIAKPLFAFQLVEKTIDQCVPPQSQLQYKTILQKYSGILSEKKKRQFIEKKRQFQKQTGIQLFRIHLRLCLASKKLIQTYKLSENLIIGLMQQIKNKFYQSLAAAGQAIGSIAAQSIGQPTTQMTLNTFHLAGVADKNVTLGVPRLQQLLDTSKNIKTPGMSIYLKQKIKYNQRDKYSSLFAGLISFDLPQRYIKDFLTSSRIFYDPDYQNSNIGIGFKQMTTTSRTPWVLFLQFESKKFTSSVQFNQIVHCLEKQYQESFQIIQGIINQDNRQKYRKTAQKIITMRLKNCQFKSTNTSMDKMYSYMLQIQQSVRNIFVSGIKGIQTVKRGRKCIINVGNEQKVDKKNKQLYQYVVLQTDGSNLKKCLIHPQIDSQKTICNDMIEIYHVLGIQAARQSFINQFKEIIKPYGIYINYRHLCVLADWMTTRGVIIPVNRNGINRVRDISVLRKASYQQTTDILFSAAVFSQIDSMRGVSQRIIFGQNVSIGTGNFKIMVDRNQVNNFQAKGKKDKQQIDEKVQLYMNFDNKFAIDRTPILNTPNMYGRSMHMMNSPGLIYAQGGLSTRSPLFTPMRSYHQQEFTQEYQIEASVMHSPGVGFGGQTPLPFHQMASTTPLAHSTSPGYYGMSSVPRMQSTIRSPVYNIGYGMSSSSPMYSSSSMSRSPDYNAPGSGSLRYGSPNSPNYAQSPIGQNRAKDQEDDQEQDL